MSDHTVFGALEQVSKSLRVSCMEGAEGVAWFVARLVLLLCFAAAALAAPAASFAQPRGVPADRPLIV